ncbi:sensor domain-containing protein [Nonomuraea thailandensis]
MPLGPLGPLGVLVDPMTWRAAPYLLVSGALGLLGYFVLAFTISVSLVLTVVWVGVPLAIATVLLWRGRARLERWLLRLAFGVEIADPYRPRPERGWARTCSGC